MAFRLKIFKVGKYSTSWSLTKLQDFGTHAWPSLRGSTLTLGPSIFDRRNARKFSLIVSFSFLSLSLSDFFFFSIFCFLSLFPFFFSFSPYSTEFPLSGFVPILFPFSHFLLHFFFSSFFSSLPFSLFSSFLNSFDFLLSRLIKVGETSPHFPHMPLVLFTQFPYFLIYFSFPLLHHSTHGSM